MKEELKKIIEESSLSEEDKEVWRRAIELNEPELLEMVYNYLAEEPGKLAWLTEMLKKKMEALKNGDKDLWEEIVKGEVEEINKTK